MAIVVPSLVGPSLGGAWCKRDKRMELRKSGGYLQSPSHLTDCSDRNSMFAPLPATALSADRFFGYLSESIISSGILRT
jgi:hypothetical protein